MLTGTIRTQIDQIWNAFWSVYVSSYTISRDTTPASDVDISITQKILIATPEISLAAGM